MSFVGIFAKRGGISISDAFKDMDDGATYWVHNNEDQCFVLKDGTQTGEVDDARDVDWERSDVDYSWKFLYRDPARAKVLGPLEADLEHWRAVFNDWYEDREYTKEERNAAYPKIEEAKAALHHACIEWVTHPKRTPIALGIYGTT